MKVLLSAYACEPEKGSEPAVGWNSVQQAARFHDVWVLTQEEGHKGIKAAIARGALPGTRFVYVDLPPWAMFWKKGRRGAQLHYYIWQLAAYFVGRRLHRKIGFDLIHHVTLGKYWMPSFLAFLPVPLIWGPVGGGESPPRSFWRSLSLRGKIYELARDLARAIGERDPFVRYTARKSAVALATTEQTAERLRKLRAKRVIVHPQFAMTQEDRKSFMRLPIRRESPFRLISIGRLVPWKGFYLGLRAFAKFQAIYPDCEYWIVNDGLEMGHLKSIARKLGVESRVTFWGNLRTLEEVYSKLAECDVLVHPALHEAFGNVCLEASASGRPVICLDLGGPALQVTEGTGIKVNARDPHQAMAELAAAMLRLATNPTLRIAMGRASQRHVAEHFDWDKKGVFLAGLYENLPNVRKEKQTALRVRGTKALKTDITS